MFFGSIRKKTRTIFTKGVIIIVAVAFAATLAYTGMPREWRSSITGRSSEAAARVNGEIISRSDFELACGQALRQEEAQIGVISPELYPMIKDGVLDYMVNRVLLLQTAKKERIKVPNKTINAKVAELRAGFATDEQFEEALQWNNLTLDDLKQLLRQDLMIESLKAKVEKGAKPSEKEDAFNKWLSGLKDKAKIEILDNEVAGFKSLQKGSLDEAVSLYQKAVSKNPGDPNLHVGLGTAFMRKKEIDKGIASFKKAVELSPDDPYLHFILGRAYREKGVTEDALKELRQASDLAASDTYLSLHFSLRDMFRALASDKDVAVENQWIEDIQKIIEARRKAEE